MFPSAAPPPTLSTPSSPPTPPPPPPTLSTPSLPSSPPTPPPPPPTLSTPPTPPPPPPTLSTPSSPPTPPPPPPTLSTPSSPPTPPPPPPTLSTPPSPPPPPSTQHSVNSKQRKSKDGEDGRPYVKKPPNAYMLFMKEQRPKYTSQMTNRGAAGINQILGEKWMSMSSEEQAKYFEEANKIKRLHQQQHPDWTPNSNRGKKTKTC